jgi:branched-chain amino acid transport system permease protein
VPATGRRFRTSAQVAGWSALAGAVVVAPVVLDELTLNGLTRTLALAVTLMGLQVLLGYGGLLSLGQGAMLGVGAWMAGVFATDLGVRPDVAIPLVALAMAAVGVAVGLPALRLEGIGLALLTLALAVSFPLLHQKYVGPLGKVYDRLTPPRWTGLEPNETERWSYVVAALAATVTYLIIRLVLAGPFGRSLRAVRDDPVAAAAFGVPVARVRVAAFAVSAAAAGVGGAILVARTPFVHGQDYPFQLSIQLFAMVLLVGSDRLLGALAGAAVITQLPGLLSDLGWIGLEDLIHAVVLLVVILGFRGRGVGPWLNDRLVGGSLGRTRTGPG